MRWDFRGVRERGPSPGCRLVEGAFPELAGHGPGPETEGYPPATSTPPLVIPATVMRGGCLGLQAQTPTSGEEGNPRWEVSLPRS